MHVRLSHLASKWVLALALLLPPCSAQSRPFLPSLSCGDAVALVANHGAVVLGTGPSTYDRFVRDGGFCGIEETTEPAWARTRDIGQCFIGYRCKSRNTESESNRD